MSSLRCLRIRILLLIVGFLGLLVNGQGADPLQEQFHLTLGQTVSPDVPGAGAGRLELPGSTDTYSFAGIGGQRIYFDELTGNGCVGSLRWKLSDPSGQILFDDRFAAQDVCGSGPDLGLLTLPKTGTYTLRLYALNDWVETYSFRLVPILDQNLALQLGDVVTNTLATPGATDTYTFTATAGQRIYFDELTGNGCVGSLRWKLNDPSGQILFDDRFAAIPGCAADPNTRLVTLPQSGIYALQVFALNDWVEFYSFGAWPITAPRVAPIADRIISAGDTLIVAIEANPSAPAGNPLRFELLAAPLGATLETNSGSFSWTAPATASGKFPVRLRVVDTFGEAVEIGFSIQVLFAPDLFISRLNIPTDGETDAPFSVNYRETNQGTRPAVGPWITRLWLSTNATLDDADTLLGEFPFNGTMQPGQFIERTLQFRLPLNSGSYRVIASTDAGNQVIEGDEDNNVRASDPLVVAPAYSATVQTETETALAGSPVILRGEAKRRGGAAAAFELVNVFLRVRGTTRILSALTDAAGQFSTTFRPLLTEAGNYTIGAAHPGETNAPVQDTFKLLSMAFNPRELDARMTTQGEGHFAALLVNRSEVPLTGLAFTFPGPPAGLRFQALSPFTLAADGTAQVDLKVVSETPEGFAGSVPVEVTSAEGVHASLTLNLIVAPPQPQLVAEPGSLTAGMVRSNQTVVNFTLRNAGGAATGPINLLLPPVPWLSVANGLPLPSLAPGASAEITLLLRPDADLSLGGHSGTLFATDGSAGVNVPFSFTALSDAQAGLLVEVVDEYTFYAEGAPRVAGATVIVREHGTLTERARGVTEADGRLTFGSLREGQYDLEIRADRHSTFRGTTLVRAGVPNEIQPFLSRETVRYEFTVVPATIEDRAHIRIETVFETFVPLPVVTIEPNLIDVSEIQADRTEIELKITNHGLIAAQNFRLNFAGNSNWRLTPLVTELGDLPARGSVTVPLVIERLSGARASTSSGLQLASLTTSASAPVQAANLRARVGRQMAADDCSLSGGGCFTIICGTNQNTYCTPVFFPFACNGSGGGFYLPPPTFGSGGAGSYYPPVCECTPINCDPCSGPLAAALLNCGIGFLPIPNFAGCAKDAHGLSQYLGDCYKAKQTNGPPCDLGAGGVAAGSYLVSCAKGLGKSVPYVGGILAGIDCYLKIKKAQDDCKGGTPTGGKSSSLARAGVRPQNEIGSFYPGTQAVLEQGRRLEAIANVFTALLGDPAWLHPQQGTNFNVFLASFADTITTTSPGGLRVTSTERATLIAGQLPDLVSSAQVNIFLNRWNRTLDYAARNIFMMAEVPSGESTDFIALDAIQPALTAAVAALDANEAEGFVGDPLAGLRFALGRLRENLAGGGGGVCARVRLRLDQDAVVTRAAFNATLDLENHGDTPLTDLKVQLQITDLAGQSAEARFGVLPPELSHLNAVDGTGAVATNSTGTASWLLVPGHNAAPSPEPVMYLVGGYFSYTQSGQSIHVPLTPAPITVYPNPRLTLTYFHERDVRSDDPFTDALEPSIPYSLGVMVHNTGFGAARNVRIISSQPKIVENEKGLLIDFDLIATEVAGQPLTPSLTADFGEIDPGGIKLARWLFKSSLQGQFIEYSATFENIGPLKDFPELATIDDVSIHELIHIVRAQGLGDTDDGQPDFLVNDIPDDDFRPDTLYLSDGSTNSVRVVAAATFDGPPTAADREVQLTAVTAAGWTYLVLPDPGADQFQLVRVMRNDGTEIRFGDNAWTTDRTFIAGGRRPKYEHRIHLFDRTSAGPTTYRLFYEPAVTVDLTPPTSHVTALPGSSQREIPVQWSGNDAGGSGLAFFDVFVSVDGGPFNRWLERTTQTGALYPGESGRRYAFTTVATDGAGNTEAMKTTGDTVTVVDRSNTAPGLFLPLPITVPEGDTVAFGVNVLDPDLPRDQFTFALGADAPPGATIGATTGRFSWSTGEGNGPSTNRFTVTVTDNGIPPLQASGQITVIVTEVNTPPTLETPPAVVINETQLLELPLVASDSDLPANPLQFSLGSGAPAGASVSTMTGLFRWRPTELQGPSTNQVEVRVSDGQVATSATLTIIVRNTAPDFEVSLGSTSAHVDESGAVPLHLKSGLDLTDVLFELEASAERLTELALQPLSPLVGSASLSPLGPDRYQVHLTATARQVLQTEADVAQLDFSTTPGSSTIVPLRISNVAGARAGGAILTSPLTTDGRVLILGTEPLLEIASDSGALTVHGNPGDTLVLEHLDELTPGAPWTSVVEIPFDGPSVTLKRNQLPAGSGFLRARIK